MKVCYVRERGFKGEGRDPLLTLGETYTVLDILFRPSPYTTQICICTNIDAGDHSDGKPYSDGGPGLFDLKCFDIVDPRVPPGWSIVGGNLGYYRLAPDDFRGDFWDRFHDTDPDAERTFRQVIGQLDAFHMSS